MSRNLTQAGQLPCFTGPTRVTLEDGIVHVRGEDGGHVMISQWALGKLQAMGPPLPRVSPAADFYAVARGPLPSDDPTQRSLEEAVARRQASNARTEALRSDWHGADGLIAGANAGKLDHVMGRKP